LHDKCAVPLVLILVEGTIKNQLDAAQKSMGGKLQYYQMSFAKKILDHNRPVCWSIVI
jgi:hypothetical protein